MPAMPVDLSKYLFKRSPKYPEIPAPGRKWHSLLTWWGLWELCKQVSDRQFQGALWLHVYKVNLCSLKLSGHIWAYACLSQIWHSSLSLGKITNVSSDVLSQGEQILTKLMQMTMVAMEERILLDTSWISEGPGTENSEMCQFVHKCIFYHVSVKS